MIGIYGIFRKSDNVCVYVGQSKNIETRIKQHLKHVTHTNYNETDYYGKEIEVFDYYDKEHNILREEYWIRKIRPLDNKNQVYNKLSDNKILNLEGNELYMISREDEHHYFTSLYRAGQYIGKQRAQTEYALLKGKKINGWDITIIDGKDIPWGSIDCDNVK